MEAEIFRRLQNLIQIGTITEVHPQKALARVSLLNRVTDFLPLFSLSNSFKRHWIPPRVKEQVAVLDPQGEGSSGVILRGIFHKSEPEPVGSGPDVEIMEYMDGMRVEYNTKNGQLKLSGMKDIHINLQGNLTLELKGSLKVRKEDQEILTVLSEFMDELIQARTATLMGPQALLGKKFIHIKKKLDLFKGSL